MLSTSSQPQIEQEHGPLSSEGRTPFVSVIIPAFNVAQYIGEALDSVFAQTFRDFELIVINDGSPDSEELERVLQPYLDRITYLKQPNRGPSSARNLGIRSARGRFIALLDADDAWLPEYLAQQMRAFEADPTLDLVYSDALLHGGGTRGEKSFMDFFPSAGPVTIEALLEQRCVVITSCVVVRRQAVCDAGLFDEKYFRSEDFDLWVRLAHRGANLAYQREILAQHRVRGDSLAADRTRMQQSAIEVYENLAQKLDLTISQRRLIEIEVTRYQAALARADGKSALAIGDHEQAAKLLSRARDLQRVVGQHDWKISLALSCLTVAPRAFQRVYQLRERLAPSS